MGKAVMLSVNPLRCEGIAKGEISIEVRKNRPKLETPFKCYIYCTGKATRQERDRNIYTDFSGKVIGEFICDKVDVIQKRGYDNNFDYCYLSLNVWGNDDIETEITDIKKSCIRKEELNEYGANAHCLYAWHISDLKIYDRPKELSEFDAIDRNKNSACKRRKRVYQNPDFNSRGLLYGSYYCEKRSDFCQSCHKKELKHSPQSWCYVKEVQNEAVG